LPVGILILSFGQGWQAVRYAGKVEF